MVSALTWNHRRGLAVCLAMLLGLTCALSLPRPATGQTYSAEESGHVVLVDPEHSQGLAGWRLAATTVRVVPTEPGVLYYQWDTPVGPWQPVDGEIMVPEGRHTLLTRAVDVDGNPGPVRGTDFRIDFDAMPVPQDTRSASGVSATGIVAATAT